MLRAFKLHNSYNRMPNVMGGLKYMNILVYCRVSTDKEDQLNSYKNSTFKQLEDLMDVHEMTNAQLKRLINKIEADRMAM